MGLAAEAVGKINAPDLAGGARSALFLGFGSSLSVLDARIMGNRTALPRLIALDRGSRLGVGPVTFNLDPLGGRCDIGGPLEIRIAVYFGGSPTVRLGETYQIGEGKLLILLCRITLTPLRAMRRGLCASSAANGMATIRKHPRAGVPNPWRSRSVPG